ncbi:MAG TPA: energy transducer TonB [Polyangia bacterium]|nr:energy transducer TonB [Polyangia bacterium]
MLEDGSRPAIVDLVFGARSIAHRRRLLSAVLIAVAAHGSLWVWATRYPRRLPSSSSGPLARVRDPAAREAYVDLVPAPPPRERPRALEPRVRQPPPPRLPASARALTAPSRQAPAPAGAIVAQEPDPSIPLDLTGETFVTGTAHAYRGGVTASGGTSTVAGGTPPVVDPRSAPGPHLAGPDRSRAISLEEQSWSCPWPREGDTDQIDEQTVIIRVVVGADGKARSAEVLSDPGHGFGPAAVACAMRTRFTPALDRQGEPVRARSPPIKVRFTR